MIARLLLAWVLGAVWLPPAAADPLPLAREQHLDPGGAESFAAVRSREFLPLQPAWQFPAEGSVRWERLGLAETAETPDRVLYVHLPDQSRMEILYPPTDPECGHWPAREYPDASSEFSVSGWFVVPLCPGVKELYLHHRTTRGPLPLVELRTRVDAAVQNFLTAGRVYMMTALAVIALVAGLIGFLRYRDRLGAGLVARILLASPYFLRGAAAPAEAPMAPLAALFARLSGDQLMAMFALGHTLFVAAVTAASRDTPRRPPSRAVVDWLPTALALTALVVCVTAPFPHGQRLAMVATLLSLPCGLIGLWMDRHHEELSVLAARERRIESLLKGLVVISASLPALLIHVPTTWTDLPLAVGGFFAILALFVAVRGAHRRSAANAALFAERLARQRTEDIVRQQRERRQETRDLMLMLTHEIRTPLSVLRISADQAPNSPAARRRVHDSIAEMDRLVERCLETARLDEEEDPAPEADWDPAVDLPELAGHARDPGRIEVRVGPGLVARRSRPAVVNAIVGILIDNAGRYGAPDSPIVLEAQATIGADGTPGLKILVENRIGPFGPPDPARLFTKYYRGPGAHRQSGAGLGLFLASRLAERLGGQLSHASDETTTRFRLWMPR